MMIEVLKSKLHCVQVTEANLNYMGSITIDEDLMDAANLFWLGLPDLTRFASADYFPLLPWVFLFWCGSGRYSRPGA